MKKFFALVLAIMMVMSLAVPAAAAGETYTFTLKAPVTGHTYGAYQIFKGNLHDGILSDVSWGSGIDTTKEADLLNELKNLTLVTYDDEGNAKTPAKIFKDVTSASDVAGVITEAGWTHDNAGLKDVASVLGKYLSGTFTSSTGGTESDAVGDGLNYNYTITGLEAGYYLMKDITVPEGTEDYNHFYTDYILHITKDVTVSAKGNVPIVDKDVFNASENQFMDHGDTYIGREITYRIEATLPSYFAEYDNYWFEMKDTLSSGLDYVLGTDGTPTINRLYMIREGTDSSIILDITHLKGTMYNVSLSTDQKTMTIRFPELKGGKTFIAKTETGTDQEVTVRYSDKFVVEYVAKLNKNAIVGTDVSNGKNGNPNTAQLIYNNNPNSTGDGGKTPPDTPRVYTYGLELVKVDGEDNTVKLPGAEFKIWLYVDGVENVAKFSDANSNGERVFEGWILASEIDTEDEKSATTLITGSDGTFKVVGLDVGAYRMTETKAPAGYNKLTSDILIDIIATYKDGKLDTLTAEVNGESAAGNTDTGLVTITIPNGAGATLPSTGGMGTTLFYVLGSVLVMGALVMLITKKRMAAEN